MTGSGQVVSTLGSLCPITLGHVQMHTDARAILLGQAKAAHPPALIPEPFAYVLGFFNTNGDRYVSDKLAAKVRGTRGCAPRPRALPTLPACQARRLWVHVSPS